MTCTTPHTKTMATSVLLLLIALLSLAGARMTPAEIRQEYGDAVVTITTYSSAEGTIGLGSGFIVDPSGVIVTCYHVIDGAYPAVVRLLNGASFGDISVLGYDSLRDIAVIKVKGRGLAKARLAGSDDIEVGEPVVAIGNPRGLENTVSDGLLSGVREMKGETMLQISAPISPGSSGGPVFNASGQVIGVAAATLEDGQNLNFCVPIRYARQYVKRDSAISLQDFARGARTPSDPTQSHGDATPRGQFLHDCVGPLGEFYSALGGLHVAWSDSGQANSQLRQRVLSVREGMQVFLDEMQRVEAPDRVLRDAVDVYVDVASRIVDGCDLYARGLTLDSSYLLEAGSVKNGAALRSLHSADPCIVLARAYLDNGRTPFDTSSTLPTVFDSLPAAFEWGVVRIFLQGDTSYSSLQAILARRYIGVLGFLNNDNERGVVVDSVLPASPAKRSGLRKGDRIVGASGTQVFRSMWDWRLFQRSQPVGETFTLDIVRGGQYLGIPVSLCSDSENLKP